MRRAVYLAGQWKETDLAFRPLHTTYQNTHLRPGLRDMFDVFTILDVWNFAQPEQCKFLVEKHNAIGDKIPQAIDEKITKELFVAEDFESAAVTHATSGSSLAKFIADLQEPSLDGKHCIPWLGEVTTKENVLRLCAAGKLAINLRGLELLQAQPGETEDPRGCALRASSVPVRSSSRLSLSAGCLPAKWGQSSAVPVSPTGPPPITAVVPGAVTQPNIFGGGSLPPSADRLNRFGTPPKTPVNLLGEVEKWGIGAGTNVTNVNINIAQMSGAQLTDLLKKLPDGMTFSLNLEKETE